MDNSDFYPIAVKALEALEASTAPFGGQRSDAIRLLIDFIEAADREYAENNF